MTDRSLSTPRSSEPASWPEGAPRPGETIGGKYVCEHLMGAGGMGVVLAARHAQLGQQVAVKVLLPAALKDPAAADRFLRDARAATAIKSEHVARVMDFGTLDSGAPYLVMEHLAGSDLKELLEANGPLPLNDVADYALQACEALYEAHQRGIVHRDLKPANLFVTTRVDGSPLVKVLDFGISKTVSLAATASGSDRSITKTDPVFGTPAYMSPEQLRSSKQVDHRTDVWSMGAAIYELISGRLPFGSSGDGVVTMVAHILEDSPRSSRRRTRQTTRRRSRTTSLARGRAWAKRKARTMPTKPMWEKPGRRRSTSTQRPWRWRGSRRGPPACVSTRIRRAQRCGSTESRSRIVRLPRCSSSREGTA